MPEIKRSLNLFDTIMIVSGSMIGSGIFIVTADMTRVLGSPFWVLMCWVISGVITLFAALSYGELAGMMPDAGGQFIYLKRAYGRMTSFVYGWTVFTVIQTGVIAAVAVAFARYVGVFIPFFDEQHIVFSISGFSVSTTQILAVLSVAFLTFLNSRGINNGKIIQRVFTSTKILALSAVIIIGFVVGMKTGFWEQNLELPFAGTIQGESYGAPYTLLAALGVALIGSLFSSDAWNNVTFIAGEIKQPQKNIPLGLLIGVSIVTLLYILANVAYFMLLPAMGSPEGQTVIERGIAHAENDRVGTAAMYGVVGDLSVYLMALLIVISTFGCNNGLILSGARLFQAMANDKLFFRSAAYINRYDVPSKALWWQAGWASVLCLSGSYGSLLDYCTFASLVFYIVTISALFYLRKKEPLTPRPYKAFGYPVIPALYILIASAICIDLLVLKSRNTMLGLLIMAIGIPVFYFSTAAMINTFLSSYFGFNRQQRNGLLLLIGISFFLLIVRLVYPYFIEPDEMIIRNLNVITAASDSLNDEDITKLPAGEKQLSNFDPNTISYEEMITLGFTAKTAKTLHTFRTKGFVFRKKEDLLKVYGISDDFFAELKPYILIAGKTELRNTEVASENPEAVVSAPPQNREKVELNSADSLALLKVNGIGPTFAKRILKYREILGGYVSVLQLKEVYGFTEEHYEKVKEGVSVNVALARKINVNHDDFKVINKHPYISYEQTKELCNYRQKSPLTADNIAEVLKDAELAKKLMPYLAFN